MSRHEESRREGNPGGLRNRATTTPTSPYHTRRPREPAGYPTTVIDVLEAVNAGYITPRGAREMLKGDLW
jgi:hypothetical protein